MTEGTYGLYKGRMTGICDVDSEKLALDPKHHAAEHLNWGDLDVCFDGHGGFT